MTVTISLLLLILSYRFLVVLLFFLFWGLTDISLERECTKLGPVMVQLASSSVRGFILT